MPGSTFQPAMNVLISKWAPKEERSTISSIAFGGMLVCLLSSPFQIGIDLEFSIILRIFFKDLLSQQSNF